LVHLVNGAFGGGEVGRHRRHLFDRARGRIWSEAELDRLRDKVLHRDVHVLGEVENDRVVLQIGSERLLVGRRRHELMNAGPIVDVLEESDEGLALVGVAVAERKARKRQRK